MASLKLDRSCGPEHVVRVACSPGPNGYSLRRLATAGAVLVVVAAAAADGMGPEERAKVLPMGSEWLNHDAAQRALAELNAVVLLDEAVQGASIDDDGRRMVFVVEPGRALRPVPVVVVRFERWFGPGTDRSAGHDLVPLAVDEGGTAEEEDEDPSGEGS
jgi:hypothetical protein